LRKRRRLYILYKWINDCRRKFRQLELAVRLVSIFAVGKERNVANIQKECLTVLLMDGIKSKLSINEMILAIKRSLI